MVPLIEKENLTESWLGREVNFVVGGTVPNVELDRGPGPTTVALGGPHLRWHLAGGVCRGIHRKGQRNLRCTVDSTWP